MRYTEICVADRWEVGAAGVENSNLSELFGYFSRVSCDHPGGTLVSVRPTYRACGNVGQTGKVAVGEPL